MIVFLEKNFKFHLEFLFYAEKKISISTNKRKGWISAWFKVTDTANWKQNDSNGDIIPQKCLTYLCNRFESKRAKDKNRKKLFKAIEGKLR